MDINMKVKNLKEIVNQLPDDMDVIIPVISEDDANCIWAFRHVRTAGVLESDGEQPALCLNAAADGLDISSQVKKSDVICTRLMF